MSSVAEIRKALLEKRKALSLEAVAEKSRLICERLSRFCRERNEGADWSTLMIGLYRVAEGNPFREVDPSWLSREQPIADSAFAFPRMKSLADGLLEFALPFHPSDWKLGAFGLWEPREELPEIAPSKLSLVICPGVVFDSSGGRIGMGKGFYDRYLLRAQGAYRIGLAYDFQVHPETLSLQAHDQRMDALITETRVLTFTGDSSISGSAPGHSRNP